MRKLTAAVLGVSLALSTASLVSAQEDKEKTKVETKANGDYKEKTKVKDENSKYREKTKVKSHHGQSSGSCPKSAIEGEGPDHLIGQQP